MTKRHLVWLLVGWAIAFVLPPQRVIGYFKKSG